MRTWIGCSTLLVIGCGDTASTTGNESVSTGESLTSTDPTSAGSSSGGSESGGTGTVSPDGSGSSSASTDDGPKFDVGGAPDMPDDTDGPQPTCHVVDDMDAIGDCGIEAPADSFEPAVQWTFGMTEQSWVTPLVGNFTDDNNDGSIDLCDVPDVLLVSNVSISYSTACYLHVLDGETGTEHFSIPLSEQISCTGTPAFGDIDGDGLPEIVALYIDGGSFRLKAFEHDGTLKWTNTDGGSGASQFYRESGAVALHDLDADGDVEIVFNHEVYDHDGNVMWEQNNPNPGELECTTAADLDGDGEMEVITGHSAYRHDGTVYFENYPTITSQSIPQVGNLDDDDEPEIFITSGQGLWMVNHDGTIEYGPVTPTGIAASGYLVWQRPGTIHDFDGDEVSDWASSSQQYYAVYQGPDAGDVLWQVTIADYSGAAGGTAFDFLGDGVAEAMYADEQYFRIYDGLTGNVLLEQARSSPTISEYPTVADIDNDGSAEILVVSTSGQPALQAIRDADDRWIQARRIWNQHAYYVTNVREDSTIPQNPVDNWETLNTFRTNAQIEGGGVCKPRPPG
ncbi:MAG TPA: VCBS repeat-containing protein [Nannocystaceae bacterium]|nr:VCBS repeat-containing protein [Nannocystaceae bacterium]